MDALTNDEVKMFQAGNSLAFRVSKSDRTRLNANEDTVFEKIIDPDRGEIIYRKVEDIHPELDDFVREFYQQHSDIMKELETL